MLKASIKFKFGNDNTKLNIVCVSLKASTCVGFNTPYARIGNIDIVHF